MSGLMGAKEPPPQPEPPPPTPMVDEEAIKKAKQRALERAASRSGRSSTILGGSSDKLGG